MNDIKFPIMASLPIGENNAVSSDKLIQLFQLKNKRELNRMIAAERKAGAVILASSKGGYYRSSDRAEIERFIRLLDSQAKSTLAAVKSAKQYAHILDGQIEADFLKDKAL